MENNCTDCGRILQDRLINEVSGLCDHCLEERPVILERTALAQVDFQAKTSSPCRRTVRQWLREFLTTDPDNCKCGACGDWQDELDRWERYS